VLGRRLDRYVGFFFIWHFLLCLVAILGLYVVVDTFAKLDDFVEQEGLVRQIGSIARYHAYQIPPLIGQFLPVVTLIAGVITFARLARYNELNAMKAAGVSIHRTLAPVFIAALVIGALGAANQEFLVPYIEPDIRAVRVEVRKTKSVYKDLFVFDTDTETTVWVRRLENAVPGLELNGLTIAPTETPDATPPRGAITVRGAQGIWVGHWIFLFSGEELGSDGQYGPLAHRTLTTDTEAADFLLPPHPDARVPTPQSPVAIPGRRGSTELAVTFTACKRRSGCYLIDGGQLTGAFKGASTSAPTSVQAALWHKGRWYGSARTYRQDSPLRRQEIAYDGDPLPLKLDPTRLLKSGTDPTLNSFPQLLDALRLTHDNPLIRQKILVLLHARVAFPLASLVLLLVAIPFVFQQEGGKGTWFGVGLALLISLSFYFVSYAFQIVGQNPQGVFGSTPALAAWLPILVFTTAGIILTARMDT